MIFELPQRSQQRYEDGSANMRPRIDIFLNFKFEPSLVKNYCIIQTQQTYTYLDAAVAAGIVFVVGAFDGSIFSLSSK